MILKAILVLLAVLVVLWGAAGIILWRLDRRK